MPGSTTLADCGWSFRQQFIIGKEASNPNEKGVNIKFTTVKETVQASAIGGLQIREEAISKEECHYLLPPSFHHYRSGLHFHLSPLNQPHPSDNI